MAYTLGSAAKATGKSKPTILNALRKGKISGVQNENGHWQIEPAELHRVYPPNTIQQNGNVNAVKPQNQPPSNGEMAAIVAERDGLRAMLLELRSERNDLRKRLDESQAHERKLSLLLADHRPKKSWLSWFRGD